MGTVLLLNEVSMERLRGLILDKGSQGEPLKFSAVWHGIQQPDCSKQI